MTTMEAQGVNWKKAGVRCDNCRRLLFYYSCNDMATIQAKCPQCKIIHTIEIASNVATIVKNAQ